MGPSSPLIGRASAGRRSRGVFARLHVSSLHLWRPTLTVRKRRWLRRRTTPTSPGSSCPAPLRSFRMRMSLRRRTTLTPRPRSLQDDRIGTTKEQWYNLLSDTTKEQWDYLFSEYVTSPSEQRSPSAHVPGGR